MVKSIKVLWITTICLSLISYILASKSVMVYPSFNNIPLLLFLVSSVTGIAYGIASKCKIYKIILYWIGYIFLGLAMILVLWVANPREFHDEFLSPDGLQTIIIEYDHASRPTVYRKINTWFMQKLEKPNIVGTMEIIKYNVEWISSDEILLLGSDGYQYKIMIE